MTGRAHRAPATAGAWTRLAPVAAAVVLAAAVLWQTALFRNATSAVWDETIYLSVGQTLYHHADFARLAASAIAPVPVLVSYWLPALVFRSDQIAPADFAEAIRLARLAHVALIALPLVLFPFAWMLRRRGLLAACVVGGMLAFSPNIIALSAAAVTDACFCVCMLLALAALHAYTRRPTAARLGLAGAATGVAIAAKYSALVLVPVAVIALAAVQFSRRPTRVAEWVRGCAVVAKRTIVLGVAALAIAWALHGFAIGKMFGADFVPPPSMRGVVGDAVVAIGRTVPLPTPVLGMAGQLIHMRAGQPAFLLGQRSVRGWWYYFPVALALKSTPAELVVALLLPVAIWAARRRIDAAIGLMLLSIVLTAASLLTSRLDIGVRYALVLYPLAAFVTVDGLAPLASRRPRLAAALATGLVLAQLASAVGAAPRYLDYFNALLTPAGQGYTRLADSNIDWGQDLPALRAALGERRADTALLAYFGSAPPEAYGIRAVPWDSPDAAAVARCRWIAVSATLLNGVYLRRDPFKEFRGLAADARPSDSMFLFDGARSEVRRALETARSAIPVQPCRPGATAPSADDSMGGVVAHWHIRCNGI